MQIKTVHSPSNGAFRKGIHGLPYCLHCAEAPLQGVYKSIQILTVDSPYPYAVALMRRDREVHDPEEGLNAAKLALQYLNARRGGPPVCPSHMAHRPTLQPLQPRPTRRETSQEPPGNLNSAPNQRGPGKDLVCFYCQQPGPKASVCPIR